MKKIFFLFCTIITIISCSDGDSINDNIVTEKTVIKSGTSFGMCVGYCKKEIEIEGKSITYTKSSRDTLTFPTKSVTFELSSVEADNLYKSLDFDVLSKMENLYGCPDCTDGGAEWIEIIKEGFYKKIVFSFGDSFNEIQMLLNNIRSIRKKFNDIEH